MSLKKGSEIGLKVSRRSIKNPPKSAVAAFLGKMRVFLDKVRELDGCDGWYGNYV